MQSSQTPGLIPLAFAANGQRNVIPEASQIGVPGATANAASLNDGFPPVTRILIAAGGIPPSGADMNGILWLLSQAVRWIQAGGQASYNADFANDPNVGGYPKNAVLMSALGNWLWRSTADNNTTNPDATDGSAKNWIRLNSSSIQKIAVKAANYAVQASDAGTMFYSTAAMTYTLPDASTCAWSVFGIMNNNGPTPTINTSVAGQNIISENLSTASLSITKQDAFAVLMSDGANYITVSASPAIFAPNVAPVTQYTSATLGLNATYNSSVSMTAPRNGVVFATGGVNVGGTPAASFAGTLYVNGSAVSSDTTGATQFHQGAVAVTKGQAVTVTMTVATTTSPGVSAGLRAGAIFLPNN